MFLFTKQHLATIFTQTNSKNTQWKSTEHGRLRATVRHFLSTQVHATASAQNGLLNLSGISTCLFAWWTGCSCTQTEMDSPCWFGRATKRNTTNGQHHRKALL